jgi:ABC-type microcin C transport system permease subunit YejB
MHALPALVSSDRRKETYDMQTNFPVFHVEYWVYALAGLVVIVVGTLLYTVEGPIKFSSWF